ncbi:transketolase family protein [Anaerofilum sp. BX8]|uniref:Transketolase family protein n=1 Tax=Anaerofilum hominis TaxID=2763016 RepID=A0A923L200_9FIRM|nr:transketolase C-terminal domain-containing protein [Anaerofilum hominis]MBC5582389.1 transketolase family protein [Anaerofilum hominis]
MAQRSMKATRDSYGEALAALGAENSRVVVLDADLSGPTKTALFAQRFPDRFVDCGIAEADLMGCAAGMASCGLIPFASTFAMFAAGRAYEQVRNSIGYPHLNVKIGATHGGLAVGEDGATHQCIEDFALMRAIPGMTVVCPADDAEAQAAVRAAAALDGPVYLRFGRDPVPVLHDVLPHFELGRALLLRPGRDVTIAATGPLVAIALDAAALLEGRGISARVLDFHTIKPIDEEMLALAAAETGAIVTAEDHNIVGGLGSAVCEALAQRLPVPVLRVGVEDKFGMSGHGPELYEAYGLTAEHIAAACADAIALKRRG